MIVVFVFLLFFNLELFSYKNSDSVKFLLLPLNASSLGSGGVLLPENVGNEYFNPAMMIEAKNKIMELSYLKWVENINLGYLGFVYPIELKEMSFGGGITYLTTDDVPSYDETGKFIGNFSVSNWLAGFSFSKKLRDDDLFKFSFGLGFKVLSLDFMGEKGTGLSLSSGLYFLFKRRIVLSLSVRNFGPGFKINEKINKLPKIVSGEMSYRGDSFTFSIEKEDEVFKVGIDYSLTDKITLRTGYRSLTDLGNGAGISLGVGFKEGVAPAYFYNILTYFDYALCSYGDLGFVHNFSLGIKF